MGQAWSDATLSPQHLPDAGGSKSICNGRLTLHVGRGLRGREGASEAGGQVGEGAEAGVVLAAAVSGDR